MRTRNIKIGMQVLRKDIGATSTFTYEVIKLDYCDDTCKVLIRNYIGELWVWPRDLQPAKVQP